MAVDHRGMGMRRLWGGGTLVASSERQLLDQFVVARDELAFEAIVSRHGPMVARVCRSVLTEPSDVDDAFQATFLILVRKAGSLREADHLSPWLHGVARRVALQARAEARKRQAREAKGVPVQPPGPDPTSRAAEARELATLLHAELDRLSLPERSAILLCDLEGLSHQQAADQLGWPLGTVKTRVARGRERLRARLVRRGVTLSAAAFATTLGVEAIASGAVARPLIAATTRAALTLATGHALTTASLTVSVMSLTQGVVRDMCFTKLKTGAVALVATASMLAVPSLVAYHQLPRADPGKASQPVSGANPLAIESPLSTASPAPDPSPVKTTSPTGLRVKIAATAVDQIAEANREGKPIVGDLIRYLWYRRLADAEFDGATNGRDRVKAVRAYVDRLEAFSIAKAKTLPLKFNEIRAEVWDSAAILDKELFEARGWLAAVLAEPNGLAQNPKSTLAASNESGSSPTADERPPWRVRIKPQAADERLNQLILAKLDERISMPFPNDTPLSDVQKYIEQSTQDEALGLPVGIPIYVDPSSMKDVRQTLASTVSINLEGVPLRTTLALILNQLNLSYVVEGGVLIILSTDPTTGGEPSQPHANPKSQ